MTTPLLGVFVNTEMELVKIYPYIKFIASRVLNLPNGVQFYKKPAPAWDNKGSVGD